MCVLCPVRFKILIPPAHASSRPPQLVLSFISAEQQILHVRFQQRVLEQVADNAIWGGKFHLVAHDRAVVMRFKIMIVAEALEPTLHHAILKMMRSVVFGDAAGVVQFESKMTLFPGYLLAKADQTRSDSGDRTLTGPIG